MLLNPPFNHNGFTSTILMHGQIYTHLNPLSSTRINILFLVAVIGSEFHLSTLPRLVWIIHVEENVCILTNHLRVIPHVDKGYLNLQLDRPLLRSSRASAAPTPPARTTAPPVLPQNPACIPIVPTQLIEDHRRRLGGHCTLPARDLQLLCPRLPGTLPRPHVCCDRCH